MAYGTLGLDTLQSSTTGTPTQFVDGSGTQIGTLCRAWVNFNGVSTTTIRASFNVSSVTRNAAGDYTVNFTNALVDANYNAVLGGINAISTGSGGGRFINGPYGTQSTTQYRCIATQTAVGLVDCEYFCVSIFR